MKKKIMTYEEYQRDQRIEEQIECIREQLTEEQVRRLKNAVPDLEPFHFNTKGIAEILGESTDLDARIAVEIPFLMSETDTRRDAFDACLGPGATTIGLMERGVYVWANEINEEFVNYAIKKAAERRVNLQNYIIGRYDWRELGGRYSGFSTCLCLGNSLTYLLKQEDRQKTVNEFAATVKLGGRLVIDTRNYTELLRGNFLNTGKGPYRNMKGIEMNPAYVSSDMVLFRYDLKGIKHDLLLYPIKDGEMECMMRNAGFKDIKVYGDYMPSTSPEFNPKTTEFYTFIGVKK